jgi:rRNA-processing protein FCF1
VVLDGNFIYSMLKYKLDIMHRIKSLLQEETVTVYILETALDELRHLGKKGEEALNWAVNCCTVLNDKKFIGEHPIDKAIALIRKSFITWMNIIFLICFFFDC